MDKNASFTLGDHFDAFVASQVAARRYRSGIDVIRSGLRLLEAREAKLQALSHALIQGEQSGVAGPLDIAQIMSQAREAAGLAPSGALRCGSFHRGSPDSKEYHCPGDPSGGSGMVRILPHTSDT